MLDTGHELLFQDRPCGSADRQGQSHAGAIYTIRYYCWTDQQVEYLHAVLWRNQKRRGYDERYKYTGKERDEETGNDYFGARYYAAYTPMWLSPDPLMDKYPSISPYAYCNWNPMKYVDPDGKGVFFAPGVSTAFKNDFRTAVKYMNKMGISNMLSQLQNSPNIYYIAEGSNIGVSEFRHSRKIANKRRKKEYVFTNSSQTAAKV